MDPVPYNRTVHWTAIAMAVATFPLIFMGGLVTSHQAGLAVPNWPNSFEYNMFLFPPSRWTGGIFYEHLHRLVASAVGLLSIILLVVTVRGDRRNSARLVATAIFACVLFQGVLGGLRVVLVNLDLAIVHAAFAQAIFCLTALLAVMTSRWWLSAPWRPQAELSGERIRRHMLLGFAAAATVLLYVQVILGAFVRHEGAALAIPDFPLNYGEVLPPTTESQLAAINQQRHAPPALPDVTLEQIWMQFAHRVGALVASVVLALLIVHILRRERSRAELLRPAIALIVLALAQWALGVATVELRRPPLLATAHVAVGALLLVMTFVIFVRALRLSMPRPQAQQFSGLAIGPMPLVD